MRNWREPWLLQRLSKPRLPVDSAVSVTKAFGFGCSGGGGFSDEALAELLKHVRFDYMGAAEYENGDAARAVAEIAASAADYVWTSVHVEPERLKKPWWIEAELRRKRSDEGRRKVLERYAGFDLLVMARRSQIEPAAAAAAAVAMGRLETRDSTQMTSLAFPEKAHGTDVVGWLDLYNATMWFHDRKIASLMGDLFGVPLEPLAAPALAT